MIAFPNQPTPDPCPPALPDVEPPTPVCGAAGAPSFTTSAYPSDTPTSGAAGAFSFTTSSPSATPASGAVAPFLANDTERLGDEIARLAAHIHAATYRLLVLIRVFDEQEGWGWGFRSCAEWLSWRTGISPGAAREKVRAARALGPLPRISEAMARGELSYSKVRAMTRVANEVNEGDLLMVAQHATAAQVERLVRAWRTVDRLEAAEKEAGDAAGAGGAAGAEGGADAGAGAGAGADAEAEAEAERHESRYLELYPGEDGMYEIRGRLDPEVGALLEKALEWAGEALYRREAREDPHQPGADPETTHGQRWADAIGLAAERALAGVDSPSRDATAPMGRADRFQVVLHVEEKRRERDPRGTDEDSRERAGDRDPRGAEDDSGGMELEPSVPAPRSGNVPAGTSGLSPGVMAGLSPGVTSGLSVSPETTRRLACDADLIPMTHDAHGTVLDVGRKRRTVPPALRRALDYRDGGCRFPGCGCRYTDAHHIVHWAHGGETKLDNLVSLCRRHHRAVHEEGFRVEPALAGGQEVSFSRPDGRPFPEVPEVPPIPGAPARALMKGNRTKDVDPGPWTPTPLWHGETLDLGLAIDMFRGLERDRGLERERGSEKERGLERDRGLEKERGLEKGGGSEKGGALEE